MQISTPLIHVRLDQAITALAGLFALLFSATDEFIDTMLGLDD